MRALVLALLPAVAFAPAASASGLVLPPALRPIYDLAGGAPPEFGADALLRLAANNKVKDRTTRIVIIEQAFDMASRATQDVKLAGAPGAIADTEAGMRAQSYAMSLDAVSLQARAIEAMLKLNAPQAREMMLEARRPSLAPLTCADALTYDVSPYYEALTGVLSRSFTPAERAKEEHVNFALEFLSRVHAIAEVAPALRMIETAASFTPEQRNLLEVRAGSLMTSVDEDSRSFEAEQSEIGSVMPKQLGAAFAKLQQRMTQGTVCQVLETGKFATVIPATPDPEGTAAEPQPLWTSPTAKQIIADARNVRFPGGLISAGLPQTKPVDWEQGFLSILDRLSSWQPEGEEPDAQFYHEKCILYEGLMDVAPTPEMRRRILEDFFSLVSSSNIERASPEEWFFHVPEMIHRIPSATSAEQAAALDLVSRTGDPALILYATLEKLLPPDFGADR